MLTLVTQAKNVHVMSALMLRSVSHSCKTSNVLWRLVNSEKNSYQIMTGSRKERFISVLLLDNCLPKVVPYMTHKCAHIPCWKSVLPHFRISSASPEKIIPFSCQTYEIHAVKPSNTATLFQPAATVQHIINYTVTVES